MASTLHALGNLLIQSIPTVLFFIFLAVFLNATLFKPLARILEERRKATAGARDLAQQAFEATDRKTSEFEKALQIARSQIYQENEVQRHKWAEEQGLLVDAARAEAEHAIEQAREEIEAETQRAKAELDRQIQALSEQITNTLLRRRAA